MTNDSPTQILFIKNLQRPYTIPQLKALLLGYGKLSDNEFWYNKLRSQCLAKVSVNVLKIYLLLMIENKFQKSLMT